MRIGKLLFEKPVLDRCQRRASLNKNLLGPRQVGCQRRDRCELGNGLILKQKLWAQGNSALPR